MANTGDSFVVSLKEAHLDWGEYRKTFSRNDRSGEAYIPIPREYAQKYGIYNSNKTGGADVFGVNLFYYSTVEGGFGGILKAQGSSRAGEVYAKQFSAKGDLQEIGAWFDYIDAEVGTRIRVKWVSPVKILLSKE